MKLGPEDIDLIKHLILTVLVVTGAVLRGAMQGREGRV